MMIRRRWCLLVLTTVMLLCLIPGAMADFVMPNGLASVSEGAFTGNTSMQGTVYLPDSLSSLGDNAFADTNIYGMRLPDSDVELDSLGLAVRPEPWLCDVLRQGEGQ